HTYTTSSLPAAGHRRPATTISDRLPPPEKFSVELFRRTPKMFPVSRSIRSTIRHRHAPPPAAGTTKAAATVPDTTTKFTPLPPPPTTPLQPPLFPPPLVHDTADTTTTATVAAFPAAATAVLSCRWRIGHHRHGAVRRQTTIVVAVERRYSHHSRTMWCRPVATQPLRVPRCAQPFDATTVAATKPAVATTATTFAPWRCWACGGDPPIC
nr:hypothetical protein [Tanacetum cinerariifolium]